MSSFSESNSHVDYSNGHEGQYYNQQPRTKGRRSLRDSFERQPSDKHLKRRNQLLNQQTKTGRRFLYQDPMATISSGSSVVSTHEQYEWHKGHDKSDFLSKYRNRRSTVVLIVVVLLILLTLWYSGPTISTTPGIQMGRKDSEDSGDGLRSYQDLANSIRSLRKRRQAMRDESMGEGQTITRHDDRNKAIHNQRNNEFDEQDQDIQLKRLEEKIQRDQTEKVKHEFWLSKNDNNSDKSNDAAIHHQNSIHQKRAAALNNQHMSENIAALKLFNDHNNKKAG